MIDNLIRYGIPTLYFTLFFMYPLHMLAVTLVYIIAAMCRPGSSLSN